MKTETTSTRSSARCFCDHDCGVMWGLQRRVTLSKTEQPGQVGTLQPPRAEVPFCPRAPKSLASVRDVPRAADSSQRLLSLAVEP